MIKIGIMQGRLSPPTDGKFQSFPKYSWESEFHKAKQCGLKTIEWIFEADEFEKNPISSESGIHKILNLSSETGIVVESLCADYFMDRPYIGADEQTKEELKTMLVWLIGQARDAGIQFIDLPFVDASKIGGRENFHEVVELLEPSLQQLISANIILALETDLNPPDFKFLLEMINHPMVKANYDTGNSSGIGYDCREELRTYGAYIKTIHIKDRLLNNGTKPLGTGSADFISFFKEVRALNYDGQLIIQAAREEEEIETAIKNRKFIEHFLNLNSILFG